MEEALRAGERWLDDEPACRWLESPELARIVVDALFHFAGERYELFAFVVMPSHLHWVFRPLPDWAERLPTARTDGRVLTPRERIVHSLNLFTATTCNRLLNRCGRFWQAESYDHWVRDPDELDRIIAYIEHNPVKAGLADSPAALALLLRLPPPRPAYPLRLPPSQVTVGQDSILPYRNRGARFHLAASPTGFDPPPTPVIMKAVIPASCGCPRPTREDGSK